MHRDILDDKQIKLLPLLKNFSDRFFLAGGTAMALHLGHRHSIDFDIFSNQEFDNLNIRKKIVSSGFNIDSVIYDIKDEYTVIIQNAKCTFLYYPFKITNEIQFDDIITMPDVLILAAMKAYSLGRRAKWKDYVDLYFVLQKYPINELIKKTLNIFSNEFNAKLFRAQLSYFEDIDYSEKIDYAPGFETSDDEIKRYLTEASLTQ